MSPAPVCEASCFNAEKVAQLKATLGKTDGVATIFKALADETRIKVIYALSESELCVCDVAAVLDCSTATASYHLRLLHHMGLAAYRKEGKLVYYRLADPHVGNLVHEVIEHVQNCKAP